MANSGYHIRRLFAMSRIGIKQRTGELLRAQHFSPLGKQKIAGHQRRAALIALAEDLKQHLSTGLGQRTKTSSSTLRSPCRNRLAHERGRGLGAYEAQLFLNVALKNWDP